MPKSDDDTSSREIKTRFMSKPVEVDAMQLLWENWSEMCKFAGVGTLLDRKPTGCFLDKSGDPLPAGVHSDRIGLLIPTKTGILVARQNDFVIKDATGKLHPCDPEMFSTTFDPIEE